MKKYVVKNLYSPSIEEIENMCNSMYDDNYRLVTVNIVKSYVILIFEDDEVERRCN